jgi:CheY-like chemotaxis protein
VALARILVVDDSPTIRRVVETSLTGAGYAVLASADGAAALNDARSVEPDLILLDFLMPGMNGYQVVKALSVNDETRDIPIVLMATRNDQIPEQALKGLGVVETLQKPFSPDELTALVERIIAKHGVRAREETAPILNLPEGFASADPVPSSTTEHAPLTALPFDLPAEFDGDIAAAAAFSDLLRVLGDALYARGIDDADTLATSVCTEVRAGLSKALLAELVKRELGADVLRRPIPSLYGDLSAVALPEVLQLLKFQGQTGILEVALDDERYEISFKEGRVTSIRARNPTASMRLGHYFVQLGALTTERLSHILSRPDPRPLGQRLLDDAVITQKVLRDALQAQATDLMFDMLRATNGVFGLRRGPDLITAQTTPGLSVDEILFEALRRVDEASVFRKEVPTPDTRFVRAADADESGLSADELEVFRAIPDVGSRSTRELRAVTGKGEHLIEKLLYRLVVVQRIARAPSLEDLR